MFASFHEEEMMCAVVCRAGGSLDYVLLFVGMVSLAR